TWHHLVVVYNSGSVANDPTIYIDGVSQTVTETQTPVGSITLSSATLRIGNTSGDDRTFDGSIDEMKIFDYARTQGQVAYDYNRGGPIGWWKFDDCQGTTAYDSSGNGNNATLTYSLLPYTQVGTCTSGTASDAWYGGASGRFNGSIAIDVNSDSISMGDLSLFSFERTTPFSVSVWIKTSTDAAMNLVGKQDSADPYTGWSLQTGGLGFVYFQMINTFATNHLEVKTPFTYSDNVWHHIVATYSGNSSPSGIHIYVDGKDKTLETEYDLLSASIVNSIPLTVGSRNLVGQEYSGLVDDVRIYNYVLSSSQVKNIMNGGSGINFGPTSGQP
nr:LamG domain-containing protein [Candidatus Woesebacteria bacterium]